MDDNCLMLADGTELYTSQIYQSVDEFVADLPEGRTLEESETFSGMISYLYDTLFKPTERGKHGSILDYDDLDSLDRVWMIYTRLCGRYKQTPSLYEYCTLTGISPDTLTDWQNGRLRASDAERVRTIKRWKNQTVAALEKKCINNNSIGSIFTLKAAHGWKESLPVAEVQPQVQHESAAEISARYSGATLPEKPDFDD